MGGREFLLVLPAVEKMVDFKQEALSFHNERGERIVGLLEVNPLETKRIVILCHGMLGHKSYLFQKVHCEVEV